MARIKNRQHKIALATSQFWEAWYKFLVDIGGWADGPSKTLADMPLVADYIDGPLADLRRLGVDPDNDSEMHYVLHGDS